MTRSRLAVAVLVALTCLASFGALAAPIEVRCTPQPLGNKGTCAAPVLIPKTAFQNIAYLWAFVSGPTPTSDFADTVWNVPPGVTVYRYYDLPVGSVWMLHARPLYGRTIPALCDTVITVEVAPPATPTIKAQ